MGRGLSNSTRTRGSSTRPGERETRGFYTLRVVAVDGGAPLLSSSVPVSVTVGTCVIKSEYVFICVQFVFTIMKASKIKKKNYKYQVGYRNGYKEDGMERERESSRITNG